MMTKPKQDEFMAPLKKLSTKRCLSPAKPSNYDSMREIKRKINNPFLLLAQDTSGQHEPVNSGHTVTAGPTCRTVSIPETVFRITLNPDKQTNICKTTLDGTEGSFKHPWPRTEEAPGPSCLRRPSEELTGPDRSRLPPADGSVKTGDHPVESDLRVVNLIGNEKTDKQPPAKSDSTEDREGSTSHEQAEDDIPPDMMGSFSSFSSLNSGSLLWTGFSEDASSVRPCLQTSLTHFSTSYTSWTKPEHGQRISDSCVPPSSILDKEHSVKPVSRSRSILRSSRKSSFKLKRDSSADTSKDIDDIEDFELDDSLALPDDCLIDGAEPELSAESFGQRASMDSDYVDRSVMTDDRDTLEPEDPAETALSQPRCWKCCGRGTPDASGINGRCLCDGRHAGADSPIAGNGKVSHCGGQRMHGAAAHNNARGVLLPYNPHHHQQQHQMASDEAVYQAAQFQQHRHHHCGMLGSRLDPIPAASPDLAYSSLHTSSLDEMSR